MLGRTPHNPAPSPGEPTPTPGVEDRGPPMRALTPLLTAALLALVTLVLYVPAFDHAFLNWDDPAYVGENALTLGRHYGALLRAVVSHHYHPLTMWSLAWNVASPLSPRPFLVTNVALHVLNTMLVFWLVYRISGRRLPVAALVALLFGVHPMHVESVAWIAERKDVLYACFYLGGLIAYWEYLERSSRRFLALTFVLFVLSCLAKEIAITFPLAMLLLDGLHGRSLRDRAAFLEKLPFLAVSVLFGAIVLDVQGGGDFHGLLTTSGARRTGFGRMPAFTPLERVALPTYGYLVYGLKFLVPVGLCVLHPYPSVAEAGALRYLLAPLFLVSTVILALWDRRHSGIIAFGVGWYLATLLPVLQWVPVGGALMAERYTYLPYVGLGFIVASGLDTAARRSRTRGVALWVSVALLTLLLVATTRRQVETWRDSESLWSRTLEVYPGLAMAHVNRGKDREASGRTREAHDDFQTAFRAGLRTADVFEGLGSTSAALGMLDSAAVQFDRAVRADPNRGRSYYNRAIVNVQLSRMREAVADLDTALVRLPAEAPMIHGVRGYALLKLGDCRAAVADFDRALAGGVRDPGVQYGRGSCRLELGDIEGAAQDFEETLRLDPGNEKARARLHEMGR